MKEEYTAPGIYSKLHKWSLLSPSAASIEAFAWRCPSLLLGDTALICIISSALCKMHVPLPPVTRRTSSTWTSELPGGLEGLTASLEMLTPAGGLLVDLVDSGVPGEVISLRQGLFF